MGEAILYVLSAASFAASAVFMAATARIEFDIQCLISRQRGPARLVFGEPSLLGVTLDILAATAMTLATVAVWVGAASAGVLGLSMTSGIAGACLALLIVRRSQR